MLMRGGARVVGAPHCQSHIESLIDILAPDLTSLRGRVTSQTSRTGLSGVGCPTFRHHLAFILPMLKCNVLVDNLIFIKNRIYRAM